MAASAAIKQYLNNHYDGMSQEQLILMLYNGALNRLQKTKEGIKEKNIQKRGENLSSAIAIIAELNASLKQDSHDEATQFLRGLYIAILAELPKVSVNNDVTIIERSEKYISRLRDIWVSHAMKGDTPAPSSPPLSSYPNKRQASPAYTISA